MNYVCDTQAGKGCTVFVMAANTVHKWYVHIHMYVYIVIMSINSYVFQILYMHVSQDTLYIMHDQ